MADKGLIEQAKERIEAEKSGDIEAKEKIEAEKSGDIKTEVSERIIKENEVMPGDDVEAKVNEVMKKMDFENTIKNIAEISNSNKETINNVADGVGDMKDIVDELSLSSKETCDGINCIKDDMKTSQEGQTNFEAQFKTELDALREKVEKLEDPLYSCDNCGENGIKELSSYCPNCGTKIPAWLGEDGNPIKGWKPFWDRMNVPQEQ